MIRSRRQKKSYKSSFVFEIQIIEKENAHFIYSVETTYGINSVVSKLMIIVEIAETGQFLFLTMLILSYFACS
jgi:hypothetical protein